MATPSFNENVQQLVNKETFDYITLRNEARDIAKNITIGRTLAFDHWGVNSERAFKEQCKKSSSITYHAHVGMGNWQLTEQALENIQRECKLNNIEVHRSGICLDRRMGLPEAWREKTAAETGPLLANSQWQKIGSNTTIQPHMGDFMIGFPSSTMNTVHALQAGVTTIGNLSQYFSHEVPGWHDHKTTAIETTRAIALLGEFREQGVMLHSYLEDGYGALFFDCTTVAGWAYMEKYIVEDLLKAKLSHCIGGLTSDPIKRAGWVFALDKIHQGECVGSMFYGDTISFTRNFDENRAMISEYMLWDIMAQLKCPTGHAVLPLPVTEAIRSPSWQEIVETQILGNRVEKSARRMLDHVDFSASEAFAEKMQIHGKQVFKNALEGLQSAGVDINNPLQMLYVLKKMGPATFEALFAAGEKDDSEARGHKVIVATDIFAQTIDCYQEYKSQFEKADFLEKVNGKRVLLASTDVHEHAIIVLNWLFANTGAKVTYLGAEADPDKIIEQVKKIDVDAILISTHNGMALEYANQLKQKLAANNILLPVLFGGVLNQKVPDQELPIDVTQDLLALGFHAQKQLSSSLDKLLQ